MIISFVNPKGGVKKSTLTLTTATSKTFKKHTQKKIAVVETDPQGSIKRWVEERKKNGFPPEFEFYETSQKKKEDFLKSLRKADKKNKIVIIDTLGESETKEKTQLVLSISDIIVIPLSYAINDEHSFEDHLLPFIDHITLKKNYDGNPSFNILPVGVHPQAKAKNVTAYFKDIMPDYINILPTVFANRTIFENFSREGNTLSEYKKIGTTREKQQTEKGIKNIEEIAKLIIKIWEE